MKRLLLSAILVAISAQVATAECGTTSWYGSESGNRTATGEFFNGGSMTAANRTLPFGSRVRVTDQRTGRSVWVRINDRGPAKWTGRVLDLSSLAADRLGIKARGTAYVCF